MVIIIKNNSVTNVKNNEKYKYANVNDDIDMDGDDNSMITKIDKK